MLERLRAKLAPEKTAFLKETFGDELSAKLVDHLGAKGAAAFAEKAVADAQARWARFRDKDTLTEEEQDDLARKSAASGSDTIKTRAVFIQEYMAQRALSEQDSREMFQKADESGTDDPDARLRFVFEFVAEKISGDVASKAMREANLPEDLYLDIGARIYLVLVPMRVG